MTRLRFGVVGCGNIAGKSFIPALLQSQKAELISVASRDINRAKSFHLLSPTKRFDSALGKFQTE